jgi:hypothetical protein
MNEKVNLWISDILCSAACARTGVINVVRM